jgi:hypothetical protein
MLHRFGEYDQHTGGTTLEVNKPASNVLFSGLRWLMRRTCNFLLFLGVWLIGCAVCDAWLHLSVPWAMTGGAVTFIVADWVSESLAG